MPSWHLHYKKSIISYDSSKYVDLVKGLKTGIFSGGFVDNIAEFDMAWCYSPYARNFRLDGQSVVSRPWHQLFSTLLAGDYPRGIGSYLTTTPANNRLVVRHNKDADEKLYTIDSNWVATAINTAALITSDERMRFFNVSDVVYCMNGVDQFGKLNGSTYSLPTKVPKVFTLTSVSGNFTIGETVTGGTSGATGRVSGLLNSPLFVGVLTGTFQVGETITGGTSSKTGIIATISIFAPSFAVPFDGKTVVSGLTAAPNVILYSVADNYEDFVNTGSDTGTTMEQITGLASTNQALFYFTKNTVSVTDKGDIVNTSGVISYNSTYLQTQEGAVNHDSIVVVGTEIFYITPSNSVSQIVRGANVNGYDTINLSDQEWAGITEYMKEIPKGQTDSRGYYQEDTNLIHWFFKGQDSTIYNKTVIYDVINKKFLIDTNRYFYGGIFYEGKNYTISNIEAKVFYDEVSYDDQGSPIPFEYRTKYFYVSWWTFKNTLRESRTLLDINSLAVVDQTIWIDWGQKDMKTVNSDNLPTQVSTGIGTQEIGTYAIGTEWLVVTPNSDMHEIYILRTKGNLNKKGIKIQRRRTMWVVWGRVRLKNLLPRLETLPPESNSLTK